MVTVTTYAELQAAVLRDEPQIRLEANAKQYYERKTGDLIGGGAIGAVPGFFVGGPIGAAVGAAIGAKLGTSNLFGSDTSERDVARFLLRYYRKSSSGVTYIELTHR
jgi:hypothetical protein